MDTIKKLALNNFRTILNSTSCGCFTCLTVFSPRQVTNWKEEPNGRTALCPNCDSPTVLSDGTEEIETIDAEFLKKIYEGEIE